MRSRFTLVLFAGFILGAGARAEASDNPRTDLLGDPLPDGAIARLGTLRFMHTMPPAISALYRGRVVTSLSQVLFSPDGKRIASRATPFGTIRLWDAATGQDLPGPWNTYDTFRQYNAMTFSPDGTTLAAVGFDRRGPVNSSITVWDIATAKELRVFPSESPGTQAQSLAFADGGKTLVVAGTAGVRWLDATTGKEQRSWEPPGLTGQNQVQVNNQFQMSKNLNYVLSPNGQHLAVHISSYKFDIMNGGPVQYLENEATGFDLATTKTRWKIKGNADGSQMRFAFSADEKQVAITVAQNKIELRDTMTGKLLETPPLPSEAERTGNFIGAVTMSPDNKIMAFSGPNRRVMLSDPNNPGQWRGVTLRVTAPFANAAQCLTFSPDGKTLLVGASGDLQLYDVASLKEVVSWEGHRASIDHVAFSADGQRLLTGSAQSNLYPQEVATWDVGAWKRLQISSAQSDKWPNIGVLSPDHSFYIGKQGDDRFNLYDMANGKMLGRFHVANKQPNNMISFFSPNNKFFVIANVSGPANAAGSSRLYALPSCKLVCELPSLNNFALRQLDSSGLAFSADDSLVAINKQGGQIEIVETATGKVTRRLGQAPEANEQVVFFVKDGGGDSLAFSPDGKLLAAWRQDEPFLRIWDVTTGKERLRLPPDGQQRGRMNLTWSPDSRTLAFGDRKIQILEVSSGRVRRELVGHDNEIRTLAFSPDGRLLASGSADTTVLIWDVWGR
jgi:WD40 repeat protein